jgi:hypothetical protein
MFLAKHQYKLFQMVSTPHKHTIWSKKKGGTGPAKRCASSHIVDNTRIRYDFTTVPDPIATTFIRFANFFSYKIR